MVSKKRMKILVFGVIIAAIIAGSAVFIVKNMIIPSYKALTLLKTAHKYRNGCHFEEALQYYEKVIEEYPNTKAAAEASLNRIVILASITETYDIIALDYLRLYTEFLPKFLISELKELKETSDNYTIAGAQIGEMLRKEMQRFEKSYIRYLEKIPIPYISDTIPEVELLLNKDDIKEKIRAKQVWDLKWKADSFFRIRMFNLMKSNFRDICLTYMGCGGDIDSAKKCEEKWRTGRFTGNINPAGFYYAVGVALCYGYQCKSALFSFDKAQELIADEPNSELQKAIVFGKETLLPLRKINMSISLPIEAWKYVEKPGIVPETE